MSLLPSRPDAEPAEDAGPRVVGVDSEEADDVLSALSSGTARSLLAALHDDPAPPSELSDRVDTSLQNAQYHLEKLENAGAVEVVDTAYSAKGREMDVYAPADQPLVVYAGDEDEGSTLRTALTRLLGAVGVLGLASLAIQSLFGREGLFGGGPAEEFGPEAAPTETEAAAGGTPTPAPTYADQPAGGATEAVTRTVTEAGETVTPPATTGGAVTTPAAATTQPTATAMPATTGPAATETLQETATQTAGAGPADLATTAGAPGGGIPPGLAFFAGGLFVLAVVAVVLYLGRAR